MWCLDDASTDPKISESLADFARFGFQVVHHKSRQGFVKNVNAGFRGCDRDVIVLNSDTVVTREWVERLDRCIASDPRIGLISPLSNNALFLSLPISNRNNEVPCSIDEYAELISRHSLVRYPEIPSAHGFCMLITRSVLDTVGLFDEAFGQGYGEEFDLSMRAVEAGFRIACCDDLFVFHEGRASFRSIDGCDHLHQRNAKLFQLFWPRYVERVRKCESNGSLEFLRRRLTSAPT